MTTDPALIERMETFARKVAGGFRMHAVNEEGISLYDAVVEAREIAALLPDKDLEAARCMVINIMAKSGYGKTAQEHVAVGDDDGNEMVLAVLAGIRHGRSNPA